MIKQLVYFVLNIDSNFEIEWKSTFYMFIYLIAIIYYVFFLYSVVAFNI